MCMYLAECTDLALQETSLLEHRSRSVLAHAPPSQSGFLSELVTFSCTAFAHHPHNSRERLQDAQCQDRCPWDLPRTPRCLTRPRVIPSCDKLLL